MGYWYGSKLAAFNLNRKITSSHNAAAVVNSMMQIRNDHHRLTSSPFSFTGVGAGASSGVSRRYYSVDLILSGIASTTALMGTVFLAVCAYSRFETIPFTNRSHFMYLSHIMEAFFGDVAFKQRRQIFFNNNTILPPSHPDSLRVKLIATNIINSCRKEKELQEQNNNVWIDVEYASHLAKPVVPIGILKVSYLDKLIDSWFRKQCTSIISGDPWGDSNGVVQYDPLPGSRFNHVEIRPPPFTCSHCNNESVVDDDCVKWVQNCRNKAKFWEKPDIKHMKFYKWEILLFKDCTHFNSLYLPGGKILLSTRFLNKLKTDDEIAVIVGRQVAHGLARHVAEMNTKNVWAKDAWADRMHALYRVAEQDPDNEVTDCFSPEMEVEADYIGLLLMACAGYDPRVAPDVYKKLKLDERAGLLAEPMEEALLMYHEATAGRHRD